MDAHIAKVDQSTIDNNKWGAGDIMYRDLNNDGKISWGANTLEDHGDVKRCEGVSVGRAAYHTMPATTTATTI